MIILGLDTATPTASVALVKDGKLIAEEFYDRSGKTAQTSLAQPKGNHAEIILPLIDSVLAREKVSLKDLSGIAVSIGPGSFTGLRIALATVKGIAYDWGVPVVGVSTLLANAARVKDHTGIICSLLDARKQEVYAAIYDRRGESLAPLSDERVCSIATAIEALRAIEMGNPVIIGDGASAYERRLAEAFGAARVSAGAELGTLAAQVAALSWCRLVDGQSDELASLVPRYLRSSEAESRLAALL